jgi:hypothetical protein
MIRYQATVTEDIKTQHVLFFDGKWVVWISDSFAFAFSFELSLINYIVSQNLLSNHLHVTVFFTATDLEMSDAKYIW